MNGYFRLRLCPEHVLSHVGRNVRGFDRELTVRDGRVDVEDIVELVDRVPDSDSDRQLDDLLLGEVLAQAAS